MNRPDGDRLGPAGAPTKLGQKLLNSPSRRENTSVSAQRREIVVQDPRLIRFASSARGLQLDPERRAAAFLHAGRQVLPTMDRQTVDRDDPVALVQAGLGGGHSLLQMTQH